MRLRVRTVGGVRNVPKLSVSWRLLRISACTSFCRVLVRYVPLPHGLLAVKLTRRSRFNHARCCSTYGHARPGRKYDACLLWIALFCIVRAEHQPALGHRGRATACLRLEGDIRCLTPTPFLSVNQFSCALDTLLLLLFGIRAFHLCLLSFLPSSSVPGFVSLS